MFDDRLVFETPGKVPGIVRTDNIRHTHFSRNPKIAEYLKAYDYVKKFGEGVARLDYLERMVYLCTNNFRLLLLLYTFRNLM